MLSPSKALFFLVVASGCTRDPEERVCPDIAEGDLAVTEVGGPQSGRMDLYSWIEVYNTSGRDADLEGVRVRFRRLDGTEGGSFVVRRSVPIAAGEYVTLGLAPDETTVPYLDYGFRGDFPTSFLTSAALDVYACDVLVDRVRYDSLPSTGTYSLGARPPTAEANDLPAQWCIDTTVNVDSFPGSPQNANKECL